MQRPLDVSIVVGSQPEPAPAASPRTPKDSTLREVLREVPLALLVRSR